MTLRCTKRHGAPISRGLGLVGGSRWLPLAQPSPPSTFRLPSQHPRFTRLIPRRSPGQPPLLCWGRATHQSVFPHPRMSPLPRGLHLQPLEPSLASTVWKSPVPLQPSLLLLQLQILSLQYLCLLLSTQLPLRPPLQPPLLPTLLSLLRHRCRKGALQASSMCHHRSLQKCPATMQLRLQWAHTHPQSILSLPSWALNCLQLHC